MNVQPMEWIMKNKVDESSRTDRTRRSDGHESPPTEVSRRQALARLGLGASFAYAAPALLTLSAAEARGKKKGGKKGASAASGPSEVKKTGEETVETAKSESPPPPSVPEAETAKAAPEVKDLEAVEMPQACGGEGQPPCQSQ